MIIERILTGKARMNAYKDKVAETERVKERKSARVERGAGDMPVEPRNEEQQMADRHAVASGEEEKQHDERSAGVRICAELMSCRRRHANFCVRCTLRDGWTKESLHQRSVGLVSR